MSTIRHTISDSVYLDYFQVPVCYSGQVCSCHLCDTGDHVRAQWPLKDKCLIRGQPGHFQRDCPMSVKDVNGVIEDTVKDDGNGEQNDVNDNVDEYNDNFNEQSNVKSNIY